MDFLAKTLFRRAFLGTVILLLFSKSRTALFIFFVKNLKALHAINMNLLF